MNEYTELLLSLAKEHDVPDELANSLSELMQKYPDLSQWGSQAELRNKLKMLTESAFKDKLIMTE
ncbi:MAG: hypothetical protein K9L79_02100 [Methylobacter tundripaludum]|uniref:Uncharacterized protein n=1 Tax=Methylobacter tundripaludum TaxID=173365 RepID=A0A2S6H8N1_9GAMM|nr:DNA modification system-associated small protein [Methylobacter tundripaludum]MCF7964312.1 hypothetical protein [Methylobacter tundripaludum]PPK73849.1 hypothetical protein B0F88_101381 [Methylobacter tundripaludum]